MIFQQANLGLSAEANKTEDCLGFILFMRRQYNPLTTAYLKLLCLVLFILCHVERWLRRLLLILGTNLAPVFYSAGQILSFLQTIYIEHSVCSQTRTKHFSTRFEKFYSTTSFSFLINVLFHSYFLWLCRRNINQGTCAVDRSGTVQSGCRPRTQP